MFLLNLVFFRLIHIGALEVAYFGGKVIRYGEADAPAIRMNMHSRWIAWRIALRTSIALGEGYTNKHYTIENGDIFEFLVLLTKNVQQRGYPKIQSVLDTIDWIFRRVQQFNPVGRATRNVAHHYDLSNDLYEMFLDRDRQYSCAYFENIGDDLDTAQENKKRHIAAKLNIHNNDRVLDIGSGWGGMGLYLAKHFDAHVTGITLSKEQLKVSSDRADNEGLSECVKFEFRDYRAQQGVFDRIVSVGMFEHVGVSHIGQFFNKIDDLLSDDGVALFQTIGRSGPPIATDPWIRKYIFPGGYMPALSEITQKIEKTKLTVTDIEFIGPHYAETLRHWRRRFLASRDHIAAIYDENFVRMWEYYLAGSEASFRYLGLTVFQIQMTKHYDSVPMTRDYIKETEQALDNDDVKDIRVA